MSRHRAPSYLYLWPNLLLCLAPDGLALTQVLPESAGHSRAAGNALWVTGLQSHARLLRYAYERVHRQARRDDLRMLERAQSGAQSLDPGATGPIDSHEIALRWFVERYGAACSGEPRPRIKLNARRRAVAKSAAADHELRPGDATDWVPPGLDTL